MEKLPAYIIAKIERANRLAYQVEELNMQVEEWMEKNGCDYAPDAIFSYREAHGYTVDAEDVLYVMNNL